MNHDEDLRRVERVRVMKSGELAGELHRTLRGAEFVYNDEFRTRCLERKTMGIACSLPPINRTYAVGGVNVHPFFAGLLPEGLRLKALRSSLKTSEDDLFTMLIALGGESVGDVYLETEEAVHPEPLVPVDLKSADFNELLDKSIAPALRCDAVDIGVPGVMPKLSASMISFPVRVREKRKEYILKLQPKEYPNLIENEHFFMRMAEACGLTVAKTTIVRDAKEQGGLLVTRFDRHFEKGVRSPRKLHQEDACQILGVYPHDKYRLSAKQICEGISRYASAPIIEIRKFIDLYVFSYIIGNGDLHGKNVSLLELAQDGTFALSPCYDLVSTLPYGDRRMAVPLGGRDEKFRMVDFTQFAQQFDIPEKAVLSSITKMLQKAIPWLGRLGEIAFERKQLTFLKKTMIERIDAVLS